MKTFRSAIALTAMVAALAVAGASQATVMVADLTVDGSSTGLGVAAPYGQVSVNDAGGTLAFTVNLFDGLVFRDAPDQNHWSFSFNLGGTAATIGSITDNGAGTFTTVSGSHNQSPFGTFQYVVDCTSCSTGYNAGSPTQLNFVVSAANALTVNSLTKSTNGYLFAGDVSNTQGDTGNIGALGFKAAVPEPATWAMMIMGMGGVGAVLRNRRRLALAYA